MAVYKRVLLKLSGEALSGDKKSGFDEDTCRKVAKQIKEIKDAGTDVAIVIGGGNFWRGRTSENIDRTKADQIGMLATVMNCIYMSEILRSIGLNTEIMTPFMCGTFTSLFSKDNVMKAFGEDKVVFFAGGTGHPYFSTDTATVLRAVEIEADVILAAKAVDGVYSADPSKDPAAVKYDKLSFERIVDEKLGVIDLAASVLCMENKMPMLIFGLNEENSIIDAVFGRSNGTVITV